MFMKMKWTIFLAMAGLFLISAKASADGLPATNTVVTTPPVYVPDTSHANGPLPDGILAWDEISKSTDAAADQPQVHFVFTLTNVSPGNVVVLSVHPSCGCTTTELPPLPWTIAPGTNGQIGATVNLAGKSGTLIKTIAVSTDKGSKTLILRINMLPPVVHNLTEEERARDLAAAKIDRQAVFRGDCAKCHVNNIQGKFGKPLYDSVCGICHDAEHRADIVPDLHNLKTPTNEEFWRTWTAHGKPGSLMPAFATSEGGPLTDGQIFSITAYLNVAIQSQVPLNK
jgi:mono/diheme cytochrome c family protein